MSADSGQASWTRSPTIIIGAGASGLAFADSLLAEADVSIVLIDRRRDVGGHWCDAYPFVRLHTPSAYYGVGSIQLGEDRIQESGRNQGFYEQASGPEVHAYFQTVLTDRLLPSGRVRFLPRHEHLEHNDGIARMRDLDTSQTHEITVRRRVIDARYQEASIPATHIPSFAVDEDASFTPIGALPDRVHDYGRYCVIGAGKTSGDACLWLLDARIDPDRIRWIRPRYAWFIDRAQLQPLDQIAALLEGAAAESEAGAHAEDVTELFHRLEDAGRLMRLDTAIEPDMYRVTMLSRPELQDLRDIDGIVRLGHVQSVGPSHLALEGGEIAVDHDEVIVDCSARGLAPSPAVPIFDTDTIRIQQLRHASPTFNAAMIAFIEAHRDDDAERNRLASLTS